MCGASDAIGIQALRPAHPPTDSRAHEADPSDAFQEGRQPRLNRHVPQGQDGPSFPNGEQTHANLVTHRAQDHVSWLEHVPQLLQSGDSEQTGRSKEDLIHCSPGESDRNLL